MAQQLQRTAEEQKREPLAERIVDALGKRCPIPVVEAKKALDGLTSQGAVQVHVDNPTAVENLRRLAEKEGAGYRVQKKDEAHFIITLTRQAQRKRVQGGEERGVDRDSADCGCKPLAFAEERGEHVVYAFGTDCMGRGSDELGKALMKGFIYAVSQLPKLPETCIFYNAGAMLTAEGADSLADLRAMEEAGVRILTCGTCADYFQVKEAIAVGSITDMYTIVETLNDASKVVKP